jgi:hypothetical protein
LSTLARGSKKGPFFITTFLKTKLFKYTGLEMCTYLPENTQSLHDKSQLVVILGGGGGKNNDGSENRLNDV